MKLHPISQLAPIVADPPSAPRPVRDKLRNVWRGWLRTRANARVLRNLDASVARDIGVAPGWDRYQGFAVDPLPLWSIGLTPQPCLRQSPSIPAERLSRPKPRPRSSLSVSRSLGCISHAIGRAVRMLGQVRHRYAAQHSFAPADARMLADLGISGAQAQYEAERPIWRSLLAK